MLHGIDVSAYQTEFDTDGLDFVFVKSTEGRSYVNPRLKSQVKRVRDAECVVGFYHFLWPGHAKDQAEYFVEKTPEKEETSSPSTGKRQGRARARAVRTRTASSAR